MSKETSLEGLIAKIAHYRSILAFSNYLWTIIMEYGMRIVPKSMLEEF